MKYNNDIKIEQTKRISLDLLHSDILYYNIRKGTINSDISNMNTYNNIKMRKQENNYYHQNDCNNINSDDYNNVCVQKRISNKLEHFIRIEREYDKEKHYIKNNEKNNSEDDMFFLNITHFINCFIDAINILYINQSYDKITVEWLSFITRFSICFIHWMKNHDENLINFVPLNDKQFELKKRNLLFYSLFTSYTEIYNLYHSINNSNSLAGCKKRFINSKNVSKPYKHIKKIKNKQGDLYGINNLNDTKDIGDKYQRNYKRNNYYNGNIKNEHLNNYDLNNYDLNNYDLDDYHIYNNDIYNNDIYNNHIDNIHLDNNHLDNHKKDKPFIITSASSPSLPCFNISDDQFFRCENDIIKLLFDETLFNNLTITLMEFYFAIYIIQFIESKKLSILINLFCEKKKFLSKERQFLKILMSRKHIIQKIIDKNNLSTHMNEYIEYNYYLEYNKKLKKQREKLLNLIINKKGQIRTLKSIKNSQLMEENMENSENYDYFENKENKENNSLCSESTKHDNTINNNYTTSSVEDKFIYTKKKTTYNNNTNQSCDDENIYNVKEKLLKKDITNNFGYEHIEKEKYWTSICLSNIYNIRALGLFRYIHPYNINIWDKMKRILSDLSCVYIIILYIYFPFIIINLLELVWCQPIQYKENPSLLILYHMPSQVCDLQNKLFLSGVLYSCFFLIIYIILFSIYIYDTSKSIKAIGSYSNNLKSYFLFNGHNYQNRCWEIINIIKVSFIIIPFICQLYTKRNVNSKYFICCCIVLVLITEVACILFYSPYDKRSDNLLQKLSLTSSFFILISYLTVQVGFFFDVTILNIIPIFLFFYFHVYVIKQIILDFAIYKNILKRKDNHISFDKKKKSNDIDR
ncbi:hypothetical protein PFFCH_04703 [Plasmodium falciparum FCH/4]|uniref:Uncharacterized protein n=1 Tax=Plasmodium falciparum FCH/4 TaxID=1036724 RepID=A0A024VHW7_PLAFA|nr:hypothetical protein PFFCH_04703 [Plasmodium falciparum FCH/4]